MNRKLLFKVRRMGDGHEWLIYDDGFIEGFDDGHLVITNCHLELAAMIVEEAIQVRGLR